MFRPDGPARTGAATRRLLLPLVLLLSGGAAHAQEGARTLPDLPPPQQPGYEEPPSPGSGAWSDIKAYYTAPLHWDGTDWAWFGASLAAIGVARHYDSQVRTHFIKEGGPSVGSNSEDLNDALPTVAVLGGTWLYASLIDDTNGHREAWNMLEAAALSTVTAEVLKYAAGREDPSQTSDPGQFFRSGRASPSEHATAAFAVGTVLAESGSDEYRWLRRLLGYGLGFATSYERLRHNQHWLSDTVAGAALGAASARFVLNRHSGEVGRPGQLALEPVPGGALLTYRHTFE